jgi:hypothetical protein
MKIERGPAARDFSCGSRGHSPDQRKRRVGLVGNRSSVHDQETLAAECSKNDSGQKLKLLPVRFRMQSQRSPKESSIGS